MRTRSRSTRATRDADGRVERMPVRAGVDEQVVERACEQGHVELGARRPRLRPLTSSSTVGGGGSSAMRSRNHATRGLLFLAEVGRQPGASDVQQLAQDSVHGSELLLHVVERPARRSALPHPPAADLSTPLSRGPPVRAPERPQLVTYRAGQPRAGRGPSLPTRSAIRLNYPTATSCTSRRDPASRPSDVGSEAEVARAEAIGGVREFARGGAPRRFAIRPAITESAAPTSTSPSANRHHCSAVGRGPNFLHLERPRQLSVAHHGHEESLRVLRDDGGSMSRRGVHARRELCADRAPGARRTPSRRGPRPTYARAASGSSHSDASLVETLCAMASAPVMASGRVEPATSTVVRIAMSDRAHEPEEEARARPRGRRMMPSWAPRGRVSIPLYEGFHEHVPDANGPCGCASTLFTSSPILWRRCDTCIVERAVEPLGS